MKTSNPVPHARNAGLTRTQLLCAIVVVSVIVALAMPVFREASRKGRITHSLCAAKQIGTALKMYAGDNEGRFPPAQTDGAVPRGSGDYSNRALERLMPKYSTSKRIFFNKESAWCRNPAKDTAAADATLLKKGQNDWNYVTGLSEKSDARWPLIATATASATDLTYSNVTSAKGGVFGGTDAVIGYTDGSARVEACGNGSTNPADKTKTFPMRPDKTGESLFTATPEWLGTGRVILAPE